MGVRMGKVGTVIAGVITFFYTVNDSGAKPSHGEHNMNTPFWTRWSATVLSIPLPPHSVHVHSKRLAWHLWFLDASSMVWICFFSTNMHPIRFISCCVAKINQRWFIGGGNRPAISHLVGGWPTPLKNMRSSVGMMTFPTEWTVIQNSMVPVTTNQRLLTIINHH